MSTSIFKAMRLSSAHPEVHDIHSSRMTTKSERKACNNWLSPCVMFTPKPRAPSPYLLRSTLVCQRMAFHLPPNSDLNVSDNASVASGATAFDLDAWKREFGEVNNRLKQSMYFL
ncbi:hypothetical protein PM082_005717 [Marasmius tenuissimus]|nr:hypothetical protein PM082_005717 [Marasmius tenuissimus]